MEGLRTRSLGRSRVWNRTPRSTTPINRRVARSFRRISNAPSTRCARRCARATRPTRKGSKNSRSTQMSSSPKAMMVRMTTTPEATPTMSRHLGATRRLRRGRTAIPTAIRTVPPRAVRTPRTARTARTALRLAATPAVPKASLGKLKATTATTRGATKTRPVRRKCCVGLSQTRRALPLSLRRRKSKRKKPRPRRRTSPPASATSSVAATTARGRRRGQRTSPTNTRRRNL
mmetsp:Transcript_62854/g.175131  ORF Transcript_62854/g.175131 Transcript_62854/m.175131 type:complete len:232 (+) Transcript_62854:438-1133(+)